MRGWLADPEQADWQPMWLVLLGASGDAEDARRNNEQLESAWMANDASRVVALLTARIEKEGNRGVAWLEEHYIRDRNRTLEEIKAAVAALSVHGEPVLPETRGMSNEYLKACRPTAQATAISP
jgi:hypothetical protein